jgi:cyclase
MNRRYFLSALGSAMVAGLLTKSWGQASAQPLPTSAGTASGGVFTPLRRHVGTFTARGGTIGWLASQDALVVIDTQFRDTAGQCLTGLPGRGERDIDAVINTHHHGDHTSGNIVFKPHAKHIIAHANVPALQRRAAERAQPPSLDQQAYADVTFSERWSENFGDEKISARYFGVAHTSGDIVIHFEKANVVHMGDLMFNRLYPVIDRGSGGRIRHWITVLETVQKEYPGDAIYVFGHGNAAAGVTGMQDDLARFRDYLTALLSHVEKEIAAGRSKEEIVAAKQITGFEDFAPPSGPSRLPANLATAYDELTERV